MEAPNLRLRLLFADGGILTKSQKKEGLKRSWLLLKPHLRTVSDVVSYLLQCFHLHHSCPNGIILSMDGFVLPPFESTAIFKDKDLVCVKKKGTKLRDAMKAIEGVENMIEDEIIEKKPLPSDIKLLANEEYNKETGGYESETDYGEDVAEGNILPVENAPHGEVISKKRKASSRAESSKTRTKRQGHITPESVLKKHVHRCEKIRTPEKKRRHKNENGEDTICQTEVSVKDTKILEPTSGSKEPAIPEENREKMTPVSAEANGMKKVSRSTRRKRLKRQWEKEQRAKAKIENHQSDLQTVRGAQIDSGSKMDVNTNIAEHQEADENTDSRSKMDMNTKITEHQEADENSEAEVDLVPVLIRPGHIRFTPFAKAKDVQHNPETNDWDVPSTENGVWEGQSAKKNVWSGRRNQVAKESFQWNGITNKRKGQKWGMEKHPISSFKESSNYDVSSSLPQHDTSSREGIYQELAHCNGITDKRNDQKWCDEKQPTSSCTSSRDDNAHSCAQQLPSNGAVDFEKLVPLIDMPKAGDTIAYRLVELSSSWCPELSSFQVGKISWFQPESNRIMLEPVPEYPLNLEKKIDGDDKDDDSGQPSEFSIYNEDGSLEIDFPSLVDVRIVKHGDSNQSELTETPLANGIPLPSGTKDRVYETQDGRKNVALDSGNGKLNATAAVNGKKDVWEEITEALSTKKAELMQEDGWKKNEGSTKRLWVRNRSALGPVMDRLRAQSAI